MRGTTREAGDGIGAGGGAAARTSTVPMWMRGGSEADPGAAVGGSGTSPRDELVAGGSNGSSEAVRSDTGAAASGRRDSATERNSTDVSPGVGIGAAAGAAVAGKALPSGNAGV